MKLRAAALTLIIVLSCLGSTARAQLVGRLIDAIDATERSDHMDISIIFGCGLRYMNHTPASEGDTLRLRFTPLPDCGELSGALSSQPPLDAVKAIRSIETEQLALNQVDITLHFAASERYVLAPTADSHGVRIRLLRPDSGGARVLVFEHGGPPAGYAINLEASQQPFDEAAIQAATRETGNPAYVSESKLGDQTWYRLRIGPFDTESSARKVLLGVRGAYPKAWLAIGDDEKLSADDTVGVTPVAPTRPGSASTLTPPDIETTFRKAKTAFSHKDYAGAIPLLTRLLEQPEHPRRAEAQELMGLARERSRQIAHAKAEYEEYLRRYPEGPAVRRVRERLRALRLAARRSIGAGAGGDADKAWKVYGGAAQTYRRDTLQLDNSAQSLNLTSQNALISDVDFVARRRGERFNFASRLSMGYIKDMLATGPGDQKRVNYAFVELGDREREWSARFGRQSRNTGGLFGTFDGLSAGKQLLPHMRLDAAYGYPVDTSRQGFDTARQFTGLSLDFGTFRNAWDIAVYGLTQRIDGESDRQAFGTELRYFRPGRTVVALADYDTHFKALNNALLLATFALPARWTVTANLDQRKSPSLSLRNALIGQPVNSFDQLLLLLPRDEIERLALDRTADAKLYSLSVARPFGERWQWSLDFSSFNTAGTPASGGVEEVPDSGTDNAVSLEGIASSLFGGNDLTALVLRHQTGASVDVDSLGISTRFPLGRMWRIGPRLRVDQRSIHDDGSRQMLYAPTLRLDLLRARALFECELGAEIGRRALEQSQENTTRYYFSLGYRLNF
jgi:tetratricopeptide (TPR) repeat protein